MENLKRNETRRELPHFCSAGIQAPKLAVKQANEIAAPYRSPNETHSKLKPWSVFGDVLWI